LREVSLKVGTQAVLAVKMSLKVCLNKPVEEIKAKMKELMKNIKANYSMKHLKRFLNNS
jgi:hypothetical protein